MLWSKFFIPTLKEIPSETQAKSHQWMLRSGLVRQSSSGLYSYLPLGIRVLNRIVDIVRREMNRTGALEVLVPLLVSRELLDASGRYDLYGSTIMHFMDRHNREFALGPTHEENMTELLSLDLSSYKDLPLNFYQIAMKFRDELRPRFGVLRTREFLMKDAYSFHANEQSLDETYSLMSQAYQRIFQSCGLGNIVRVQADSGSIGGTGSEEFMLPCDVGEETILRCSNCSYFSNVEKATCYDPLNDEPLNNDSFNSGVQPKTTQEKNMNFEEDPTFLELSLIDTPNAKTIDEVALLLNLPVDQCIKTLVYKTQRGEFILVLIRGNLNVHEIKLSNFLGKLSFPSAEEIVQNLSAPAGYLGTIAAKKELRVIADQSIVNIKNAVMGANIEGKHYQNVNLYRDYNPEKIMDLRLVQEGDLCPECRSPLKSIRGLELGHIFKLGKKYSESLGLRYKNEKGEALAPSMGCYGIGITRVMAGVIESNHDEQGIIWPLSIAPFSLIILPLKLKNPKIKELAFSLYQKFLKEDIDVLLDDRDLQAGVKFADADLIGVPFRLTIGEKSLSQNWIELKRRDSKEIQKIPVSKVLEEIKKAIQKEESRFFERAG